MKKKKGFMVETTADGDWRFFLKILIFKRMSDVFFFLLFTMVGLIYLKVTAIILKKKKKKSFFKLYFHYPVVEPWKP